jgi:hypothetical protein
MTQLPESLKSHLLGTMLRRYRQAASRMRDDWAESSPEEKKRLWRDLHSLEGDCLDVLEQCGESDADAGKRSA